MNERFVVLGLARVRSAWFADVARWANAASIPVDFVKCLSAHDVRSRLDRTPVSAVIADAGAPGVDRSLFDDARAHGVAVIVVADPRSERDWVTAGASGVLPPGFDADALVATLTSIAIPVAPVALDSTDALDVIGLPGSDLPVQRFSGGLAVVCGRPGVGASTLSIALAQGLADRPQNRGAVVLADLALDAEQGLYHDAQDRAPSIVELVELHRSTRPHDHLVREHTYDVPARGYRLLLGLPQHRAWTALSSHGIAAAVTGLRESARWLVADVTADFEGEAETGSVDVEERNALSRVVTANATAVVVVVGDGTLSGIRGLADICRALVEHGTVADRIVPIVNRAPRTRSGRGAVSEALDRLGLADTTGSPVRFLPVHRDLETRHANVDRMPRRLGETLAEIVELTHRRTAPVDLRESATR